METLSEIDYARKESQRADMKQHADKILQGFEKISDAHAVRAIWELVQNARDVSENCEITFDFTSGNIVVTHNGEPFTSKSIISLIKQVSSKSATDNDDAVGQFGTGFITTHSFGKKIKLSASIKKQNQKYIHFDNFLIDREAYLADDLSSKLSKQQEEIYKIIEKSDEHDELKSTTVFEYIATTDLEKSSVQRASQNVDYLAPYVMVLNKRFKFLKVINESGVTTFVKGESSENNATGLHNHVVFKNGKPVHVYSLKDDLVQVILPLKHEHEAEELDNRIARLFLFFPLMGSEKFGFNFIIHSKNFAPTEPRDGVYLNSKNDQTKIKVQENKKLIQQASELIFSYLKNEGEATKNPIVFSKVAFPVNSDQEDLNDYFKKLKENYIRALWDCNIVESVDKNISPAQTYFIHQEFFKIDGAFPKLYQLIKIFYQDVPNENIAEEWTNNVVEWADDDVDFVRISDLIEKIQTAGTLENLDKTLIKHFYQYLIDIEKSDLFDKHKLLPNIKGNLLEKSELKLTSNIGERQIAIADEFIPEVPQLFLNPEFEFSLKFENYYREDLSKDFNSAITDIFKDVEGMTDIEVMEIAKPIVKLCEIFANEHVTSTRRTFLPKFCELFEIEHSEYFIPSIESDKFDYDYQPFRLLCKLFFRKIILNAGNDINWVENNLSFLDESYSIIYKNYAIEELFKAAAIIPNQKLNLKTQTDLLVEDDELKKVDDSDHLKNLYEKIVEGIREKLALPQFNRFISHDNTKTSLEMSSKIEDQFKIQGSYDNIDAHTYKKDILEIIQRISNNKKWADLFTSIDDKKAVIMMAKISNPEVKDDLFKIIGLEDTKRIKLLSTLSKVENLEQLVELGQHALENQRIENANFKFKHEIGTNIERIIRETVGFHLSDLEVIIDNQQGGQDITIKLFDKIIYYIEVKSRWSTNSSVLMSPLQIKRALEEKGRYALCSIDMTNANAANRYDVSSFSEIESDTLFVRRIGYFLDELADKVVAADNDLENLRLTDYKALIPQALIRNNGVVFTTFISDLCSIIKLTLSAHAQSN